MKVTVISNPKNRVSINNQQRSTIRTVAIAPELAAVDLTARDLANSAYALAANAVLRAGDTMTGNLTFSANSVIVFSDGTTQNTAFDNSLDGGIF
jgi:hypothetical protein